MQEPATFAKSLHRLLILPVLLAFLAFAATPQLAKATDQITPEPTAPIGSGQTVKSGEIPAHVWGPADTPGQFERTEPLVPPAGTTIEGINFDEDAANVGFFFIPPDTSGAAGQSHVVSVVNTSIEWHTKAGVQQNSQRLGKNSAGSIIGSLFEPLNPVDSLFDPKVIYDQYANRFVVVALEQQDTAQGDPVNGSRILLAVSDDSDPNGTWFFHAIDSKINISGSDRWADYPGFAVDEEAVYITANMFGFGASPGFGGSRLWIVNKGEIGGFYDGGAASVTVHDPSGAVGQAAATAQPAHVFGAGGVAPGVGTFLVRYSGFSDGTNEFLSIIRVDNPLGTPSFSHQFVAVGNIDNTAVGMPDAPQSGTATLIETNDRRALNAVWRNNSLWTTAQVVPPSGSDAGQVTAHWWEVDTTNLAALSLVQQGNVGGEDIASGAYTFFPSIAVDETGNMGIGFAASAPTIFPGAFYTGRLATDPAGTVQSSGTLAAGQDFYIRTFGASRNRWGDYSGISIDPSDDATFWVFNEYALTRGTAFGGEDGRWGTRFGSFTFGTVLPTISINDVVVTEGNAGTVNADFTVSLSAASSQPVTVNYASADDTAMAASDYVATFGNLTFNPGETSKPITVQVNGDTLDEPNETFFVNLSNATNATISDGQGQGTILDDDPAPSISINDVTVTEGNVGTVNANFTVSLSAPSGQAVTVKFATANGTAKSGSDYVAKSGTLTFNPGDTSKTVTVTVKHDTLDEANETFFVNLSTPINAILGKKKGIGTIIDDDPPPSLSINNVTVTEGNTGSLNAVFKVSLSAPSGQTVKVKYATANGTATAGSDYVAKSGTLSFSPGQTSKNITIAVIGDTVAELTETFFVNLSNATNADIANGQGVGTIIDND